MPIPTYNPINENLRELIGIFGTIRESSMIKYIEECEGDIRKAKNRIVYLLDNTPACKVAYGGKSCIKKSAAEEPKASNINAFEAYKTLLKEAIEQGEMPVPTEIQVGRATYPYDYVLSLGNKLYMLLVFDHRGFHRIEHHNMSIGEKLKTNKDKNFSYVLVVIIPDGYKIDALAKMNIQGDYRFILQKEIDGEILSIAGEIENGN